MGKLRALEKEKVRWANAKDPWCSVSGQQGMLFALSLSKLRAYLNNK